VLKSFFQVYYPNRERHFSHEFAPLPHPPSRSPYSERDSINAMRRKIKFLKPVHRSLFRYQSYRFIYLF
jgi:hypothetical protein